MKPCIEMFHLRKIKDNIATATNTTSVNKAKETKMKEILLKSY